MIAKFSFNPVMCFGAAAGFGLVEGVGNFSAFGLTNDLAKDVLQDLTNLPVTEIPLPDNLGEALEILSDDPTDTDEIALTVLGPGAGHKEPYIVELSGTTPVPLPGLVSRINGATSVGSGFNGDVIIRQAGGGTTFVLLRPEEQEINQCLYTVPFDKRWTVGQVSGAMRKSGGGESEVLLDVLYKPFGGLHWHRPFGFGLQRGGASSANFVNLHPSAGQPATDIKLSAISSHDGASCTGWIAGHIVG